MIKSEDKSEIEVDLIYLYTRQDKVHYFQSFKNLTINMGKYNKQRKCMENIYVKNNETMIFFIKDIRYSVFKKTSIQSTLETLSSVAAFRLSYVGSAHTSQRNSIDCVFVGEYNIREQNYISKEEKFSCLYTCMTRVKKQLIIVR